MGVFHRDFHRAAQAPQQMVRSVSLALRYVPLLEWRSRMADPLDRFDLARLHVIEATILRSRSAEQTSQDPATTLRVVVLERTVFRDVVVDFAVLGVGLFVDLRDLVVLLPAMSAAS